MKMGAIIDKASVLYRNSRNKEADLRSRLYNINAELEEGKADHYDNMTVAYYNALLKEKEQVETKTDLQKAYSDGIGTVREMLMDLDFDTEVEK